MWNSIVQSGSGRGPDNSEDAQRLASGGGETVDACLFALRSSYQTAIEHAALIRDHGDEHWTLATKQLETVSLDAAKYCSEESTKFLHMKIKRYIRNCTATFANSATKGRIPASDLWFDARVARSYLSATRSFPPSLQPFQRIWCHRCRLRRVSGASTGRCGRYFRSSRGRLSTDCFEFECQLWFLATRYAASPAPRLLQLTKTILLPSSSSPLVSWQLLAARWSRWKSSACES
jgi:hypothetical protein